MNRGISAQSREQSGNAGGKTSRFRSRPLSLALALDLSLCLIYLLFFFESESFGLRLFFPLLPLFFPLLIHLPFGLLGLGFLLAFSLLLVFRLLLLFSLIVRRIDFVRWKKK